MVGVTERAKETLLEKRVSAQIRDPNVGLRLVPTLSGDFTLMADRAKAGDQVVKHGDSTVLLVDAKLSELVLAGRTVDCREGAEDGSVLVLRASGTVVPDVLPRSRELRRRERRRPRPPLSSGEPPGPATAA